MIGSSCRGYDVKVNIILSEQKEPIVTRLEKNESFGNVEALTGQVKRT